jgi:hypothetical protein
MEQNDNNKPNMPKFNMNWIYVTIIVALAILFFTNTGSEATSNGGGGIAKQDNYYNFKEWVMKGAAKEVIINEVDAGEALSQIGALKMTCQELLDRYPGRQRYIDYWQQGYDKAAIKSLAEEVDRVVDYLSNSRDQMVLNKAMDYPVIRQLLTYCPVGNKTIGSVFAALFPIGLPVWLVGLRHQKNLKRDVNLTIKTCDQLVAIFNGEYSREMEYK